MSVINSKDETKDNSRMETEITVSVDGCNCSQVALKTEKLQYGNKDNKIQQATDEQRL